MAEEEKRGKADERATFGSEIATSLTQGSAGQTEGQGSAMAEIRKPSFFSHEPRVPTALITSFLRQMVMLLEAGVTLLKSINSLASRAGNRTFRKVLTEVGNAVEGGSTLWQAFAQHPRHFDLVFVNVIKLGETSGTLPRIMRRMAEYREKKEILRKQVLSAMIYPIIVAVLGAAMILFFMYFLIPTFEDFFDQLVGAGGDLPLMFSIVVTIRKVFFSLWWFWLVVIVAVLGLYFIFVSTRRGRLLVDGWKLKIPVFGNVLTKAAVADFARTMTTLLAAGISILETLELTRDGVRNKAFAQSLQDVRDSIERGEGLEKPLRDSKAIPAIVTDMLVTGEESGSLDLIAGQVADIYEQEVDAAVVMFKNLMEPVMLFVVGGMVAFLWFSFFLPYIDLIKTIMDTA